MSLGLVGQKVGMTRVFQEDGSSVPVTVIAVQPNRITQIKTVEKDGYDAVQVTCGKRKASRVNSPMAGHFGKAGVEPGRGTWEFRADADQLEGLELGGELKLDVFESGQKVDIRGTTIGKGFAGTMKRYGFGGGRASHGNSLAHRKPGSIGQNQDPGRVFPGKKMAGQMGNVSRTQQNLEIVSVDTERNLLLIKGSIPGPKGFDVVIQRSVKSGDQAIDSKE